jgi:hypothetical protein
MEVHCVLRKVQTESLSIMYICFIFKVVNLCFYQKSVTKKKSKQKDAEQDPDLHAKY